MRKFFAIKKSSWSQPEKNLHENVDSYWIQRTNEPDARNI